MVNKFSTSIQGYKKEEVNDFVKEVTVEYESMLRKLKNSCEIIETLKGELWEIISYIYPVYDISDKS